MSTQTKGFKVGEKVRLRAVHTGGVVGRGEVSKVTRQRAYIQCNGARYVTTQTGGALTVSYVTAEKVL